MNTLGGTVPSATVGSVISVSATGGVDRMQNAAAPSTPVAGLALLGSVLIGALHLI